MGYPHDLRNHLVVHPSVEVAYNPIVVGGLSLSH